MRREAKTTARSIPPFLLLCLSFNEKEREREREREIDRERRGFVLCYIGREARRYAQGHIGVVPWSFEGQLLKWA